MARLQRMFSLILSVVLMLPAAGHAADRAIFAGGCFWCVEKDFEGVNGVLDVVSGYTGGAMENPSYDDHQGHVEAVEITFDPARVDYATLVSLFLRSIDVTDAGGQFCDRGPSYVSAIFVQGKGQEGAARDAVAAAEKALGQRIVTPIRQAGRFWPAEDYHQDYARKTEIVLTRAGPMKKKNAYKFYREACGRDARVKEVWGSAAAFVR